MFLLGSGIGMLMQVLVVATQNEAPVEHLGVATSTIGFFRAVGGSVGVAVFGSLFTSRITDLLGDAALNVTPEAMSALPPAAQQETASAFADAITTVFGYAIPLLLVAFVLAWFVKETPLRTASGDARRTHAIEIEFGEDALMAFADPSFVPDDIDDLEATGASASGPATVPDGSGDGR
jgi:hypothetical protein